MHHAASVASAETVWTKVRSVACLAVDLPLAISGSRGIKPLVTNLASEAALVPLPSCSDDLLCVVH